MYQVSAAYIAAIESGAVQHIHGTLTDVNGDTLTLDDSTMVGNPSIDLRCVEDEEVFMIGQMYTGELSMILNVPYLRRDEIIGGEVRLWFSVDGAADEVPLGVFDVTSAERESGSRLTVKAVDHISRLDAELNNDYVGVVFAAAVLEQIETVAKVEFAQTIDEINALLPTDSDGKKIDIKYDWFGTHYLSNCRDEVRAIAQLIGGFAFANREGKIEFRRFSKTPVRTIPVDLRKSIKLSEYNYRVRQFSYTGSLGHTVSEPVATQAGQGQSTAVLNITDNKYIWDNDKNYKERFDWLLYPLCAYFSDMSWVPGTIEYYGDPALDLGDMVLVKGGITESEDCKFLICSNFWQFRSPQQLTAPGVPRAGSNTVSSSGGSASSGASGTQINITKGKTIEVAELNEYPQDIDMATVIADGVVNAKEPTWAFLHYNANLQVAEDCTVNITSFMDGAAVVFAEAFTLAASEYKSAERVIPIVLDAGEHLFSVKLETNDKSITISNVSAQVWGQNIVGNAKGGTGVAYIQDILETFISTSEPETIRNMLTAIDEQRDLLANILTAKGVEADEDETLNTLVAKVADISGGSNEAKSAMGIETLAGGHVLGDTGGAYSLTLWNCWQETNADVKTTATVTAAPTAPCLLIVAAMCRDEVSIDGDGWTKVAESVVAEGFTQKIVVWAKSVSKGTYAVTVNQASSARLSLKAMAIYKCSSLSLIDNTLISAFPHTPTASSGKRRLYLLSSVYVGSANAIAVKNDSGIDLKKAEQQWFSVFYDYQPELNAVPAFGINLDSYVTNTAQILTFDINGEE